MFNLAIWDVCLSSVSSLISSLRQIQVTPHLDCLQFIACVFMVISIIYATFGPFEGGDGYDD